MEHLVVDDGRESPNADLGHGRFLGDV